MWKRTSLSLLDRTYLNILGMNETQEGLRSLYFKIANNLNCDLWCCCVGVQAWCIHYPRGQAALILRYGCAMVEPVIVGFGCQECYDKMTM